MVCGAALRIRKPAADQTSPNRIGRVVGLLAAPADYERLSISVNSQLCIITIKYSSFRPNSSLLSNELVN